MTNGTSSNATGEEIGGPGSIWQDEEEKKFYEELRELRGEVPGSVLGVLSVKEKEGPKVEEEKEKEIEDKDKDEMEVDGNVEIE